VGQPQRYRLNTPASAIAACSPHVISRWQAHPAGLAARRWSEGTGIVQDWLFPWPRRLGKHIVAVSLGRIVHSFAAGQGLRRSSKNLLEESVSRFCYGIIRLCASRSPAIPEYTPGSPGFPPAPTDFPPAIPVGTELSPVGGELDKSETRFPPAVPVAPPAIPIVACSDRRVARKNPP
jgi:hypothetical protein